ncbi:hypothetical protein RBA41_25990 [Massilia sp. CCM 9210]|uniref:hypothetical protein n=1 Tax=Massilia scottii TaxID=3057166 RepID=UPI002796DEE6|nr:hypothetical protein [Massilia sp. CCM 9210]MDQ1816758.1 hypothetical protein [Massilia sp. CCM 9210]
MASRTWPCGEDGPKTVPELRKKMIELVKNKSSTKLIDVKFTRDHIFAGHKGDVLKLAQMLAKQRELAKSTLMITSMQATAKAEILNWIAHIPDAMLTYQRGVWTVNTQGSTVPALYSYKWVTVDLPELKRMMIKQPGDIVKKCDNWMTESLKSPEIACQFDYDGTPLIYHLDY